MQHSIRRISLSVLRRIPRSLLALSYRSGAFCKQYRRRARPLAKGAAVETEGERDLPGCGTPRQRRGPENKEGGERPPATPLYLLCPGGGDGYRETELVLGGDGPCGPSPGYARQRGRQMPADRPIAQALPIGRATNFMSPPDCTRNNTVCFPSLRASARPLLTSSGVKIGLPPMSRITSPTCRP